MDIRHIAAIGALALVLLALIPEGSAQDYIRTNPAISGFDRAQQRAMRDLKADALAQEMAIRERELARAIEAERQKGAIDAALRRGLMEMYGDSADPVLRALLATPGGGAAALKWIEKTKPMATP